MAAVKAQAMVAVKAQAMAAVKAQAMAEVWVHLFQVFPGVLAPLEGQLVLLIQAETFQVRPLGLAFLFHHDHL